MDPKIYIELANISKDLLIERRRTEWKMTFGFLAAIGTIAYSLLKFYNDSKLKLSENNYWLLFWGLILITIVFAFWHLPSVAGSNRKDLDLIRYYRQKAQESIDNTEISNVDIKKLKLEDISWLYAIKRPEQWHCFVPQIIISLIVTTIVLKLLRTLV